MVVKEFIFKRKGILLERAGRKAKGLNLEIIRCGSWAPEIKMKKILLVTIWFLFLASSAFADSPVLFFSDITGGPKTGNSDPSFGQTANVDGAIVTIWGKNFGASQNSSTISCAGTNSPYIYSWSDTKIAFQVSHLANDGTGVISINVDGVTSNTIPFTVRSGNIYFVKTTGNDSSGDGSWDNPWKTIVKAKNTLQSGDIAYICDGVNQTTLDNYNACINLSSHGEEAYPKALVTYPGANVTVGSLSVNKAFGNWVTGGDGGYRAKYWVISQFNLTAASTVTNLSLGYRIVGNTITTPNGNGASAALELGSGDGSYSRILGNEFHNCGTANASKLYHNIYINNHTGHEITDIEIGWNIIRDSTANRGIQVYSDGTGTAPISGIKIHDNKIYNLRGNGINLGSKLSGENEVYNNIVYKCGQGPHPYDGYTNYAGIYLNNNSATVYMYNNLIYDCGFSEYATNSALLHIYNFSGTPHIKNNILYSNGTEYEPYLRGTSPSVGAYYNLFYGNGTAPSWDTAAVNSDPFFQDLNNYNFHLTSNSPAKDAGTSEVSSIVTRDYDGNLRPQDSAYDIGAYEYSGSQSGNSAPVLAEIGNKGVSEENDLSFTISATDADDDALSYSVTNLPLGATFSDRTLSWTPAYSQAGVYSVIFTVNDGNGGTDSETITITVNDVDLAAAISLSAFATPTSGTAPLTINFSASASSTNGSIVRYEWDFEGKGNYSWNSSSGGNCSYIYSATGNYVATVRVTDSIGGQDTYSILIQVQDPDNAPQVTVSADATSGTAPLKVYFRVNATFSVGISKYEWDFEGDGIYEYKSRKSGNVVRTYSKSGVYVATLKVTDFAANSKATETIINVSNNSSSPSISLTLNAPSGTAPYMTTFTANNLNDSSLIRYEWDFEGDGTYDKSTYNQNSVSYTYKQAGLFNPTVRVTNKDGLSALASSQIIINENGSIAKPVASFTATPEQGEAPLNVSFADQSTGNVTLKTWDFNGDSSDDWVLTQGDISYVYNDAGYYLVSLKVVNDSGMLDKASRQIKITSLDDEPIVIIEPKNSQVVKGFVTLSVIVDPRISPSQVEYQYQLQGEVAWNAIEASLEYPYFLRWDTTAVSDGIYLIRAVATNSAVYTSDSVTITVNNQTSSPDTQENTTTTGEYLKQTNIESEKSEETYLYDGTKVEIPSQTVSADDTLSVTIVDADLLSNKVDSSNSNLTDVNSYRDVSLASNSNLDKEAFVRIPYEDADDDGYVDGSDIKEETLDLYRYDENSGEWLKAFDIIVHPDENFVEAKTNHLSLFALAVGSTSVSSNTESEGKCFIATASYGTKMADEVVLLRKFRDQYLLTNRVGKAFVRFYYRHSPPIADFIRNKPILKSAMRFCLKPLVKLAKFLTTATTEKTQETAEKTTQASTFEEKGDLPVIMKNEPTVKFQETELNFAFNLIGTVMDADPKNSLAIIKYTSTQKQNVLKIGDSISDFKLVKIERAKITLLKDGKLIPLEMPSGNINEPILSLSEYEKVINRNAIAKITPDLNSAVNQVIALANLESGKISGIKIKKILNKELAEKAGIREGDVVLSVNDHKIDGLKKPFEIYSQVRNEKELRVQIKRKGEIKNLVYYLD